MTLRPGHDDIELGIPRAGQRDRPSERARVDSADGHTGGGIPERAGAPGARALRPRARAAARRRAARRVAVRLSGARRADRTGIGRRSPGDHGEQARAWARSSDLGSGGRGRGRQPLLLLPSGLEPRRACRRSRNREILHPRGRSRPGGDSRGSRRPAGGQSAGARASTWRDASTDQGVVGGGATSDWKQLDS